MLFHMLLKGAQASVVNELLDDEISVLGEEIEKRSSRKPCGFTWRCRRRSKRRRRFLQKRVSKFKAAYESKNGCVLFGIYKSNHKEMKKNKKLCEAVVSFKKLSLSRFFSH